MTIFSSFSANFSPHYHTILAINCVHASNWFTHLQQIQQTDGQSDNSDLTVCRTEAKISSDILGSKIASVAISQHQVQVPVNWTSTILFPSTLNGVSLLSVIAQYQAISYCISLLGV